MGGRVSLSSGCRVFHSDLLSVGHGIVQLLPLVTVPWMGKERERGEEGTSGAKDR